MKPRVLITGPIAELQRWADAARVQGWEPIVFPLLEIRHRIVHLALELEREPDWVCVTSKHAVRFLEEHTDRLKLLPFAAVGGSTAHRLEQAGFEVRLIGPHGAAEMAERLLERPDAPLHVLWPRGSASDDLGKLLRARGVEVCAPVVYETNERTDTGPMPAADVVFFSSPSAVRAYTRRIALGEPLAPCAISIGQTTFRALSSPGTSTFPRVLALDQPTPEQFGMTLVGLEVEGPGE